MKNSSVRQKKETGLTPEELYELSVARAKVVAVEMRNGALRAAEQKRMQNRAIWVSGIGGWSSFSFLRSVL